MKRYLPFMVILILATVLPTTAQVPQVDPILIDKPNRYVYECTEDLVLELLVQPVIDYAMGGRHAKNYFLYLTVEFLYLQDIPWNGLHKNSFWIKHTDSDGQIQEFPLNYMMTAMMSMKNGWQTMADQLEFPSLVKLVLVFDVDTMDHNGWSLMFRPAQRSGDPVCEVEVPLVYQAWW